jgi:hypothetical protein
LLKATHLPYVLAIMIYESAAQYMYHQDHTWDSHPHTRARPLLQRRVALANSLRNTGKKRLTSMVNRSEISLAARTPSATTGNTMGGSSDDMSELKRMILKLNERVEDLSAVLQDRQG